MTARKTQWMFGILAAALAGARRLPPASYWSDKMPTT